MLKIDYNDLVKVNLCLEDAGLSFKTRLKDETTACIEPQGQCACDGKTEEAVACIQDFYRKKGLKAEVTNDQLYFHVNSENVHHGRYNMDVADLEVYGIREKAKEHMKRLKK